MRAAYARVSTAGQSVDVQLARLEQLAPGATRYVDPAVSGRLDHRPEFDRLRAAIERDQVQEVFVTKLDRLGRSARGILEFFELAERHGVRVVVTDQGPIDTSTPVGRLVRTVLAAMAELEADLIQERTRDAIRAIRAGIRPTRSGRPIGRPKIRTPELVAETLRLRAEGTRWADIARRLHHPAASLRKWSTAPKAPAGETPSRPSELPPAT